MNVQAHLGEALRKGLDHGGQGVAGLGMGGGDGQSAAGLIGKLITHLFDIVHLLQHPLDHGDDDLPRLGQTGQTFTLTLEDQNIKLLLQQLNLIADPRLGGVQYFGGGGDVESHAHNFPDKP